MGFGKTDVHISKALSNFAIQYKQKLENFIADKVAPPLTVSKEADKYFKFDRGNWRVRDALRGSTSESNRSNMPILSSDSYNIEERSLHDFVSFREIDEADAPLQPRQDCAASLVEQLLIIKEIDVAKIAFTTTAVGGVASLAAATYWDGTSTTTPVKDVLLGIYSVGKQIGQNANIGVTNADVLRILKDHDDIADRIKYTYAGSITKDMIANLFDLDELTIGQSVYMTTDEGITSESVSYVWGDKFLLSFRAPRPAPKQLTHVRQFAKRDSDIVMKEWEDKDKNSQKIEGSVFYDVKIPCSLCGYMINDVLS